MKENNLTSILGDLSIYIDIYNYFKNRNNTHVDEFFKAMREKSKKAYNLYCRDCDLLNRGLGTPLEKSILGYWESCSQRNVFPSVEDMVASNIAGKEEAEVMFPYLFRSWMEVPDFVQYQHDILTTNKLDELAKKLNHLHEIVNTISELECKLEQRNISDIATLLSSPYITNQKELCADSFIKRYYMVDNRFVVMIRVISAGHDIPHIEANEKMTELIENGGPIIIAGNGGLGKTSLMMRAAVQWVSRERIAVWLSLSNENVITEQKASAFFDCLISSIPDGQRVLLCIDNPYEGRVSLSNLQKVWPNDDKIQLVMAERANRLSLLAEPTEDFLLDWFDNAQMIILQGLEQSDSIFVLKDYVSYQFSETQKRRQKILEKGTSFLAKEGLIKENDRLKAITIILNKYGKPNVSLVELIYRTLFELKKRAEKMGGIKLDWDEWGSFIESEFGDKNLYTDTENALYGVIAALKIFNTPITTTLFCKYFDFKERKLRNVLNQKLMLLHTEPIIFCNNTLQPKHDVIAELFFLFHEKGISINTFILDLLDCMDKNEIEALLANMVIKKEFKKGIKYHVGRIQYKDYMNKIYNRVLSQDWNLSKTGMANLCLGYLWSRFQQNTSEFNASLNQILNEIAPKIDPTMVKLYTEWGIWLADEKKDSLAEEKFLDVIRVDPENIHSRTELGKLLSKQKGREKEAEEVLRQVINIDSKNLHARTVLAQLYENCNSPKEALKLYQEVCQINPKDSYGLKGLERLKNI